MVTNSFLLHPAAAACCFLPQQPMSRPASRCILLLSAAAKRVTSCILPHPAAACRSTHGHEQLPAASRSCLLLSAAAARVTNSFLLHPAALPQQPWS
jgi:hypothetical protein